MDILNTVSLESNTQMKINFDGGDLSSDAGLFLSPHPCEYGSSPLIKLCSSSNPMKADYFHPALTCASLS